MNYLNILLNSVFYKSSYLLSWVISYLKFTLNGVEFETDFAARGVPIVHVHPTGSCKFGYQFKFNSGKHHNMIGRPQPCYFVVGRGAQLTIGNNVGLSSSAFACYEKITISDNVRIGGGCVLYDTDFHSLDVNERTSAPENKKNVKTKPIFIKRGAFIGGHSMILKGVIIGENSVVGAGSVVVKSIPDNEVWAGNPAKFIRRIIN